MCVCVCVYTHINFSTMLDKGLRKNIKRKRDGEIGKLSEMGALYMK